MSNFQQSAQNPPRLLPPSLLRGTHLRGAGQERGEESQCLARKSEDGNRPNSCDATTKRIGRASASVEVQNWDVYPKTVYTKCLRTF